VFADDQDRLAAKSCGETVLIMARRVRAGRNSGFRLASAALG
jgi:hypothetical protein